MTENKGNTQTQHEDDPIAVRKTKRQAIIDSGAEPYARFYDVDAHAADLTEKPFSLPPKRRNARCHL